MLEFVLTVSAFRLSGCALSMKSAKECEHLQACQTRSKVDDGLTSLWLYASKTQTPPSPEHQLNSGSKSSTQWQQRILLRDLGLCKVLNRKLPDNWDECLPKLTEEDAGKARTTQRRRRASSVASDLASVMSFGRRTRKALASAPRLSLALSESHNQLLLTYEEGTTIARLTLAVVTSS